MSLAGGAGPPGATWQLGAPQSLDAAGRSSGPHSQKPPLCPGRCQVGSPSAPSSLDRTHSCFVFASSPRPLRPRCGPRGAASLQLTVEARSQAHTCVRGRRDCGDHLLEVRGTVYALYCFSCDVHRDPVRPELKPNSFYTRGSLGSENFGSLPGVAGVSLRARTRTLPAGQPVMSTTLLY